MADDEEIAAAFELFDRDGKGVVAMSEMKNLLYSLGVRMEMETDRDAVTLGVATHV